MKAKKDKKFGSTLDAANSSDINMNQSQIYASPSDCTPFKGQGLGARMETSTCGQERSEVFDDIIKPFKDFVFTQ